MPRKPPARKPKPFDAGRLPAKLDRRVRSELGDGERLLWVGQPRLNRFDTLLASLHVLFGIPLVAVGGVLLRVAHESNVDPKPGPLFFIVLGAGALLIGLGFISYPYRMRWQAKRTCYALTDRRAMLWLAGSWGGLDRRSYAPEDWRKAYCVADEDGYGDLIFEKRIETTTDDDGKKRTYALTYGFKKIDGVREVENLLRKVSQVTKRAGSGTTADGGGAGPE